MEGVGWAGGGVHFGLKSTDCFKAARTGMEARDGNKGETNTLLVVVDVVER